MNGDQSRSIDRAISSVVGAKPLDTEAAERPITRYSFWQLAQLRKRVVEGIMLHTREIEGTKQ
jgi:hypothetical protein